MNISRHNYDTCFLLYADGELSPAERQSVEDFAGRDPEMARALAQVMAAVLPPPPREMTMPGRHLLFRPEPWDEAALTPLQTDMLLQLDGELGEAAAAGLAKGLSADPVAAADWKSLCAARLAPVTVEMPHKETLYRKQRAAVIPLLWIRRFAAAALLFGLGWLAVIWWSNTAGRSKPLGVAVVKNGLRDAGRRFHGRVAAAGTGAAGLPAPAENGGGATLPAVVTATIAAPNGEVTAAASLVTVERPAPDARPQKPEAADLAVAAPAAVTVTPQERPLSASENAVATAAAAAIFSEASAPPPVNAYASPAVYNETAEDDDFIYVAGARIRKQKLRNLVRTVGRTVGRSLEKTTIARVGPETQSLRSP